MGGPECTVVQTVFDDNSNLQVNSTTAWKGSTVHLESAARQLRTTATDGCCFRCCLPLLAAATTAAGALRGWRAGCMPNRPIERHFPSEPTHVCIARCVHFKWNAYPTARGRFGLSRLHRTGPGFAQYFSGFTEYGKVQPRGYFSARTGAASSNQSSTRRGRNEGFDRQVGGGSDTPASQLSQYGTCLLTRRRAHIRRSWPTPSTKAAKDSQHRRHAMERVCEWRRAEGLTGPRRRVDNGQWQPKNKNDMRRCEAQRARSRGGNNNDGWRVSTRVRTPSSRTAQTMD